MKIIDNENILIENVNNEVYISFRPYNIELNLNYIVYWTKRIIKEYETFILYCQSYNFDGLNEIVVSYLGAVSEIKVFNSLSKQLANFKSSSSEYARGLNVAIID